MTDEPKKKTGLLIPRKLPRNLPKISTRALIKEIAVHTSLSYDQVADVIYALTHYIEYVAVHSNHRVPIRHFGTFYPSHVKGRMYGQHVGAGVYYPDRIKLGIKANVTEVDKWKSTQLIRSLVLSALSVTLPPHSMDLSVAARIAEHVLSNKPVRSLSGAEKVKFFKGWISAIGASPLIPTAETFQDSEGPALAIIRYRLRGDTRSAFVFDGTPTPVYARLVVERPRDILFFANGWTNNVRAFQPAQADALDIQPYGDSPEDNCLALYQAYQASKYGKPS